MARDLSFLDEGETGGSRLTGRKEIPVVSEDQINADVRKAGEELGVDKTTLAYEAGFTGSSVRLNTLSPEELAAYQQGRRDKVTQFRETGGETEPPYEAPEGTYWSFIGGKWNLYKDFVAPSDNAGGAGGGGGGGGNGDGANTGNTNGTSLSDYYASIAAKEKADAALANRTSAYNILYDEFNKYGLGSLVSDIKNYLIDNTFDPSEFSIQLQNTDAYKKRFAANEERLKKGLKALSPAAYINLEDQYQEVMRRYGLPASYYTKGDLGIQAGFNKLISNDVSSQELEDRIMTAQNRLINTDVNTLNALRQFYPNITSGDLLAYTLDPDNAINDIKRKAAAAEIGGAALAQGLIADVNTAEGLAKYGITKAQAQQGYQTIGEFLPTATALADIYKAQGLGPYTQATAEAEVFNTSDAADAARKRKKLAELEKSTFGGQAGIAGNALSRDRASAYQGYVSQGAGSF